MVFPPFIFHLKKNIINNNSHIFAEDAWYKTLTLDGGAVKFKLDTGADVSVMTKETWRQLNPRPHLKAVQTKLMTPSEPLLPSPGQCCHSQIRWYSLLCHCCVDSSREHTGSNHNCSNGLHQKSS